MDLETTMAGDDLELYRGMEVRMWRTANWVRSGFGGGVYYVWGWKYLYHEWERELVGSGG